VFAGDGLLERNYEVKFDREVWLRISPPCVLDASGSKLTVFPQGIPFERFIESVKWEQGIPGYLTKTEKASKSFDFDLTSRVSIKAEMVLRIVRTTANVTKEEVVIVVKGSKRPKVLRQPKK
jgi:hypothetical protein